MRPSIARASEQLELRSSQQTYHRRNQPLPRGPQITTTYFPSAEDKRLSIALHVALRLTCCTLQTQTVHTRSDRGAQTFTESVRQ